MEAERVFPFSVASVVEDVLQQHGTRLRDIDLASRKAEETSLRRYEAARWLRKTVGVVGAKDLPAEPSEDDFRLGLRSGIILCNVLNKVQPGAVPKVVESPYDSVVIPDGAALSAFQYFENVRNFLVAVEVMGLPTFEASDLEQGGKSVRIVNCVLALKSYSEWKQSGGNAKSSANGLWKFGGNGKPQASGTGKPFVRKNAEIFVNSIAKTLSGAEKSVDSWSTKQSTYGDLGQDLTEGRASINELVQAALSDQKQEDIQMIVESMLNKVMEEFECRLASQNELLKTNSKDMSALCFSNALQRSASCDIKAISKEEEEAPTQIKEGECQGRSSKCDEESESHLKTQQILVEQQRELEQQVLFQQQERDLEQKMLVEHQQRDCKQQMLYEQQLRDLKQQMLFEQQERYLKQKELVEQQQRYIQELKQSLRSTQAGVQILQMKYQEEFNILGKHLHGLAHAATGYRRVLEENRKLYNQVQDLKGNIRVYCRVRPFLPWQPSLVNSIDHIEEGTISLITPSKYGKEGRKSFTFNKVFGPSATQAEVFSDTQPLIRSILDGYNVCIFAYGQTGSGKTYTMTGPKELTEEGLGVNYRALTDLFLLSNQRKDTICYDISVQMLEIYNEQVRDLLVTDGQIKKVEIRNSSQNGINVPEANLVPVSSTFDVINLMNLGHKNRAVGATAMNDRSSRSHSCLTVHVQGRDLTSGSVTRGSMHLVDLAGSERVDKSEVTGDRLKEAQHINKSLSALGDVISSLAQKNSHVPYRNSKLTQLLQDSLGGQAKTLMFVHISPEPEALGETISTLKFAERVGTIELGAARVNKDSGEVKELKEQIASLKAALARKEGEAEQLPPSRSRTPDRRKSLGFSSHPKWQSTGDLFSNHSQQTEDSSSVEVPSNSESSRRHSLDLQELMNSPPWPPMSSPSLDGKEDDRESSFGDWVDKIMVNKNDRVIKAPAGHWNVENRQLAEMLYQSCIQDSRKVYPEQLSSKLAANNKDNQEVEVQRIRYEVATTDESDDAATSDCSETDSLWHLNVQLNVPKGSNIPGLAPKTKKPQPKPGKATETKSQIPSLIPQPTRKPANGTSPHLQKPGRHPVAKRKPGHAK